MKIWTMGEILVEIMRPGPDIPLGEANIFRGPYPSGAPANFIDTVAQLGHQAGIIGGVGDDDFGRATLSRLQRDGVDTRLVMCVKGKSTGVAFVAYDSAGERAFIFHMGGTPATDAKCPEASAIKEPAPAYFHLMGCSLTADEGFCNEIVKTASLFHSLGAKLSFDPNIRPELLGGRGFGDIVAPIMERCSVLLPGLEELKMLAGRDEPRDAVAALFKNPTLEVIALKLGADGCRIFTRDMDFALGACDIEPVDPTGAGDSFDAGFICGLISGMTLQGAARQASAAAALCASAFGPMEGDISPGSVKRMIDANKANLTER